MVGDWEFLEDEREDVDCGEDVGCGCGVVPVLSRICMARWTMIPSLMKVVHRRNGRERGGGGVPMRVVLSFEGRYGRRRKV